MIPLIQQEVVDKKGWLKESEFVEMMAIAQSAPGPIALNTAIFVGYKARGIKGVIFSSLGTILDRKSTRLNSSHTDSSRMPSSA